MLRESGSESTSLLVIPSLSMSSPAPSPSCIPHLSPSLFVGIGTVPMREASSGLGFLTCMYTRTLCACVRVCVFVCGVCVCDMQRMQVVSSGLGVSWVPTIRYQTPCSPLEPCPQAPHAPAHLALAGTNSRVVIFLGGGRDSQRLRTNFLPHSPLPRPQDLEVAL